jgi:hypothetical protein
MGQNDPVPELRSTTHASTGWQDALGIVMVVVGAVIASSVATVLVVDAGGGAPHHNAGASFAIAAGWLASCAVSLTLGLLAFVGAWAFRRSQSGALFSTMVGLTPAALTVVVVLFIWTP